MAISGTAVDGVQPRETPYREPACSAHMEVNERGSNKCFLSTPGALGVFLGSTGELAPSSQ